MDIFLTNTATRRKELFVPLKVDNVRMYVCGPTVYDRAHLGNARPVIVFDLLYRLLRHVYGTEHVTYVRNFTDVDDKINARAAESGRRIEEITAETTQWFLDDMGAVGALQPDQMPRATQYIPQMVTMIEDLIGKGHAYAAEGHVLFSVDSYAEYGRLSGRSVEDMIAGARVEVAPYKRHPMDFVLWKPSTGDQPGWESPWGRGRPGWHIECSAMAFELLGESFDIHGGGNDLMFPHHENEIAQSCCAHPGGGFAKVWLHNEMLQVEGKKMSKSLGNFFTVHDLLDEDIPGEVIRFVMLSTHYRKPMDWTVEKRLEAETTLSGFLQTLEGFGEAPVDFEKARSLDPNPEIIAALANDLETYKAINVLKLDRDRNDAPQLARDLVFLGFFDWDGLEQKVTGLSQVKDDLSGWVARLSEAREQAMQDKDFGEVDRLKSALTGAGVEVRMSKTGVELVPGGSFDASKLEALS